MGRRRKMTKAQMRMKYYDATKRLSAIHNPYFDNKVMMAPYPFAPPAPYAMGNSYPPNTYGRHFPRPPPCNVEDFNIPDLQSDVRNDEIPAAITKEEDDDPKSLDNKRLIADSTPSTDLEVALKAELDKQVKRNETLSSELDKLRQILSKIQAHQSNEPLPPHGLPLHAALSKKDREQPKPPQTAKKGPRNGYNMFYSKVAPELKGTLNSYKELAKVISEKWKALSQEEKENYEFDAEIFNIMDERDSRDSNGTTNQHANELDTNNSFDREEKSTYYPPPPNPSYQYDMSMAVPPGPPPGPPPPGMLFDMSIPPPPPYDFSFAPPPPSSNDMFGNNVPQPPPNYMDMKPHSTISPSNTEYHAPPPAGLSFKIGSPCATGQS